MEKVPFKKLQVVKKKYDELSTFKNTSVFKNYRNFYTYSTIVIWTELSEPTNYYSKKG